MDTVAGTPVTTATVTAELVREDGSAWVPSLALSQEGSTNNYSGLIAASLTIMLKPGEIISVKAAAIHSGIVLIKRDIAKAVERF